MNHDFDGSARCFNKDEDMNRAKIPGALGLFHMQGSRFVRVIIPKFHLVFGIGVDDTRVDVVGPEHKADCCLIKGRNWGIARTIPAFEFPFDVKKAQEILESIFDPCGSSTVAHGRSLPRDCTGISL